MLFNSYEFLFLFLPGTLLVYFALRKFHLKRLSLTTLILASFLFYAWWNPIYLPLLLFSICVNYSVAYFLLGPLRKNRALLMVGLIFNIGLLAYFKYSNFLLGSFDSAFGTGLNPAPIILPLAISFFTFQKIAFIVDAYRGDLEDLDPLHYMLFVSFFPQLIAGPIVHHREIMPQFAKGSGIPISWNSFAIGISIFTIGLFKKTVIADHLAPVANKIFGVAEQGHVISLLDAWAGAISYTFQLYFDFSGYSDMAIGAALMFGIVLPVNFNAPYKAASIIEFWKRWHMTLSRFLRDYVYFTLGGNRRGEFRRYINLFLTMLIGGIWHGAGWTFLIWGALHGTYLVINHGWATLRNRIDMPHIPMVFAASLTFFAVVFGWVVFRAKTIGAATTIYAGMLGQSGFGNAKFFVSTLQDTGWLFPAFALMAASITTWLLPTAWSQFMRSSQNFKPARFHGMLILVCWIMIIASFGGHSEFLYFQF